MRAGSGPSWLAILVLATTLLAGPDRSARAGEDYDLDEILTTNVFRPDDMERIRAGEIVRRTWSEFTPRDISIALAFLIRRDPLDVVRMAVEDFEDVRLDSRVKQAMVLPEHAGIEHFAGVVLAEREAKRYLDARPGTALNLSGAELRRFGEVKRAAGGREEVQRALRSLLLDRYRAYRAAGLEGLAPYARGRGEELRLGPRLAEDIRGESAHALTPRFREVILHYPDVREDGQEDHFVWIEYEQDGRQIFVLRHRVALKLGRTWAMMERDYYVSGYYNAAQGFWAVLPAEGGALVFYGVRSNTDQAKGVGARMRHSLGRRMMASRLVKLIELQRRDDSVESSEAADTDPRWR